MVILDTGVSISSVQGEGTGVESVLGTDCSNILNSSMCSTISAMWKIGMELETMQPIPER